MKFFFDLQRFAEVTLLAGETYTLDGVTYTAITDVTITIDENGATIAGGKVNVSIEGADIPVEVDVTDGSLSFDSNDVKKISFTAGTTFSVARDDNSTVTIVAKEDTIIDSGVSDQNIIYFRTDSDSCDFDVSLVRDGTTVIGGTLTVGGMFSYSPSLGTFALVYDPNTLKNSFAAMKLGDYTLKTETAGSTVIAGVNILSNGKFEISYPREDHNTTNLTITRDDTQIFNGTLSIIGSMILDRTTNSITLTDGSEISAAFGDYEVTATADGNAAVSFALTESGLAITPAEGDGTLNITLGNESGSMSANVEVLSGSFVLGENGAVTIAKDTELQIDFGDAYTVNFKTTDDAGGSISLGTDGITFTPNDDDGHLELSVTRDDVTRKTSLEMTGSLTYKLDGSISLAKDTVVKNEFEDGTKLAITALTDASGSIVFTAQDGLTITPSTADALTLDLTSSAGFTMHVTELNGTLKYAGGTVILSDGTSFVGNYDITVSEGGITFTNEGGKGILIPVGGGFSMVSEDGAKFSFVNERNHGFTVNGGKLTVAIPYQIAAGSDIDADSPNIPVALETAGTYTLNGMNVTTTVDNVAVTLIDNDAVTIDGITFTPLDENVALTIGETGATVAGGKVSVSIDGADIPLEVDVTDGSLSFDSATKNFTFAEGAILSMQAETSTLQFVAKEDFSIGVDDTDDKISFKLDGAAELEIVNGTRTATLDFTGGLVYESGGSISLDDGTVVNLTWADDDTALQITSHGSAGSIALDADKGLKITSDDENLDIALTTPQMSTDISGIKGTIYYKAGTVSFDDNSTITATTTLGGQPILTTLETVGGTGHISFSGDINGVIYSADTGALKITWARDALESTFTVNGGTVQIGHGLFKIAEGTELATDLKNFVPALYFTTSEAGTYTINGQTIRTTAEGLNLTATDDQMVFTTSSDVVEYDGMTFAGSGNVSLKPDNVVLGAGVEANGFGEDKSFVLAEAGNVTADAKIFELAEDVPTGLTVTGAQDGFVFSRTITEESEARLNIQNSPDIGKIFSEKFISAGDSSYRITTDLIGLEEVIGISDGATVTGGATFDGEKTLSYYALITDTTGKFTIGERTYVVGGDSSVAIMARFEEDSAPYASMVDSLNGTVSGDFSGGNFSINGSSAMKIFGDTDVSIVADDSGFEVRGLDTGASLQVSSAGNYSVNGTAIAAGASAVIVGTSRGTARLYDENYIVNTLPNTLITATEQADTIENLGTNVTIQALGGDDFIINNVDSTVTAAEFGNLIAAGDGNDTVYNHHTYNPTIYGGAGDDSIVISRGHKTFADGGAGNDSILGVFANNPDSDWAMGGHATILGGDGDDFISTGYTNDSTIDGGNGDDSIITCGLNNTINGGAGNNFIQITATSNDFGSFIVLNGNTTVDGFNTGFGAGTDTVYVTGDAPAVDFKADGLTLYYDDDGTKSLTFAGLSATTKLNIYYEQSLKAVAGIFIADDEWYSVTENDLSVANDRELGFVGATAEMNHGADFSGIADALNISLNTDYAADADFFVNNVHSVKGGAGSTTITGSDKSDTILAGAGDITIDAAGGDDVISLGSASALIEYNLNDGNDLIRGFNKNSTLNISGAVYSSKKSGNDLILTVGDDKITLQGAANLSTVNIDGTDAFSTENLIEQFAPNEVSIVAADDGGKFEIELGGGDLVIVEGTHAKVGITASDDSDTIVSAGKNVTVNLNGGDTKIFARDGKIALKNYDAETGAGLVTDSDAELSFDSGRLSIDSAVVDFGKVSHEIVNFYDEQDHLQQFGFAGKGKSINVSGKNSDFILIGNTDSTLKSGAGNDTIFADNGGFVDAGAGNNFVDLGKGDKYGTTVALTSKGNTTVDGFNAGFDRSSDALFFAANDSVSLKFDGNDLTFKSDGGATGVVSDIADDEDFVKIFVAEEDGATKTILAKKDATIPADDLTARAYLGENSAVDFSNVTKNLLIDLGGIVDTQSDTPLLFSGITQITAGSGHNTLIGSDADETLIAGNSDNSLYGAGGRNLLQGYSGDDKDGSTKFFVLGINDGAANTISNFAFVNAENHATSADVIEIDAGSNFVKPESIAVRGADIAFTVENGSTGAQESVLVENAASTSDNVKDMYVTDDDIAQVSANDLCFDDFANFYVATGSNATLNVSSAIEGDVVIWLDDDAAAENDVEVSAIFAGDIKVIDATNSDATAQLAGNELDNKIYAGNGDASLWGGNGGDDLLVGGAAQNIFFYTLGNGNDTVTGVNDGDSVILAGVKLEEIIGADFTNNALTLNFSDGGTLTVNDRGKDVGFVVEDQTFYVDSEREGFSTEK